MSALHDGLVIPAHPLALGSDRRFDETSQRALTRYYHASGAGGLAVAVHTTQFEIRKPEIQLLRPLLELAAETSLQADRATGRETLLVAGIVGDTDQACGEAELAVSLGYDVGLLSLAAFGSASNEELIQHCTAVARIIPLFGFYLQPSVGGRLLDREFWMEFAAIPNVVGIKAAPFNRYQTIDVFDGVARSGRADHIALYTGNDDHIVEDLMARFPVSDGDQNTVLQFCGGLLGHWAVWTSKATSMVARCKLERAAGSFSESLREYAANVTRSNAALFDAANGFKGCIAGLHYVLARQGLLESIYCLDPAETLSRGQAALIEHVYTTYPELTDDEFVKKNLTEWRTP